jgi:aspartate kinase
MAIVVQKFGGSSVADVEKLGRVADKVVATRRAGFDVVVVVSAMGKTTDQLLALAKQIDDSPPRRELDMLVTTGERVSMALLSMAIQKRGCDAISFTGSQCGIITNDRHFDAKIIEVRPHRLEDELARGRVVIVAGYQGMSYKREITTLGRGGSDTTALALAAALGAERAEIYSDVDGVYSADPRVVPSARHLPEIGYEEMQEMSDAGARVLCSTAVSHARGAGLPIHARSTFAPGRETRVHAAAEPSDVPRAVVGQRSVVRVSVRDDDAVLLRAMEIARAGGVSPCEEEKGSTGRSFLLPTAHAPDWTTTRARLAEAGPRVELEEGLGLLSVVGAAVTRDPDRVRGAMLARSPRRLVTTPLRVSALVAEDALDDLCRALHAELIG